MFRQSLVGEKELESDLGQAINYANNKKEISNILNNFKSQKKLYEKGNIIIDIQYDNIFLPMNCGGRN